MTFPLESLYTLVLKVLFSCKNPGGDSLQREEDMLLSFEMEVERARLAVFTSIAIAANSDQINIMLHISSRALADLQKKVMQRIELEQHHDDRSSLYRQMLKYLETLADFIDENFDILDALNAVNRDKYQSGIETKKMVTNLTIAQLACILRLMVDAGFITEPANITRLSEGVAAAVITRKNMPVSAESLRIKYYKHDTATINIVREHLQNMLQLLRGYAH